MAARPASLQDHFLNGARRAKAPVTIFLLKGVKLQGVITWFDSFSLLLRRDGQTQLVYKHSISTILPARAFDLAEIAGTEEPGRQGLQDSFLSAAAREAQQVTMFLVNGVMLQGRVAAHDQFSLLLERGGQIQLVYKHAISTIQPEHPLALGGDEAGDGQGDT
ncbi:MAG TPA: RNA chaperone Hfq [Sphingomicrobium sp.]|nr:RNA chaperone Hfq [Sphingomicrobium sp.]